MVLDVTFVAAAEIPNATIDILVFHVYSDDRFDRLKILFLFFRLWTY